MARGHSRWALVAAYQGAMISGRRRFSGVTTAPSASAVCYLDGVGVEAEMVRQGLARDALLGQETRRWPGRADRARNHAIVGTAVWAYAARESRPCGAAH